LELAAFIIGTNGRRSSKDSDRAVDACAARPRSTAAALPRLESPVASVFYSITTILNRPATVEL
jgi:hypothetical protein